MKKQFIALMFTGFLLSFSSCREQNPQDPSANQDMDGVAKSVREGREKAVERAGEGQKDSILIDSFEMDIQPVRDSLQ